jgi:hypothetical protein
VDTVVFSGTSVFVLFSALRFNQAFITAMTLTRGSKSTAAGLPKMAEAGELHHSDSEAKSSESLPTQGVPVKHRRTMWKIDSRLIPILTIVYLFAFLDRANIGNANVFGLSTDLGLHGSQYNVALCIFFVPYILFEVTREGLNYYAMVLTIEIARFLRMLY